MVITFGSARPDTWLSYLASVYMTFHPGENGSGELKFSFTASADRKGQRLLGKVWKGIGRLKWAGRITDRSAGLPKDAPPSVGPIKAEENGLTLRGEATVQRASAMVIPLMVYRYFEFF